MAHSVKNLSPSLGQCNKVTVSQTSHCTPFQFLPNRLIEGEFLTLPLATIDSNLSLDRRLSRTRSTFLKYLQISQTILCNSRFLSRPLSSSDFCVPTQTLILRIDASLHAYLLSAYCPRVIIDLETNFPSCINHLVFFIPRHLFYHSNPLVVPERLLTTQEALCSFKLFIRFPQKLSSHIL